MRVTDRHRLSGDVAKQMAADLKELFLRQSGGSSCMFSYTVCSREMTERLRRAF